MGGDTREWKLYAFTGGSLRWDDVGTGWVQNGFNHVATGTESGSNDTHDVEVNYDDTLPVAPNAAGSRFTHGWTVQGDRQGYIAVNHAVAGGFLYQGS